MLTRVELLVRSQPTSGHLRVEWAVITAHSRRNRPLVEHAPTSLPQLVSRLFEPTPHLPDARSSERRASRMGDNPAAPRSARTARRARATAAAGAAWRAARRRFGPG